MKKKRLTTPEFLRIYREVQEEEGTIVRLQKRLAGLGYRVDIASLRAGISMCRRSMRKQGLDLPPLIARYSRGD